MSTENKIPRPYAAPNRGAAAQRTRASIVDAAKRSFEDVGWAGTTIAAVARSAGVSPKTIESAFGTKAALLAAAFDYAMRGDIDPIPVAQRPLGVAVEQAHDAKTMLRRHARYLRAIHERSARIAWTVETAADADAGVAELWRRMTTNRESGVRWATETLRTKAGRNTRLSIREVEEVFWIACDWGVYRTLTGPAGLSPDEYEAWLRRYYRSLTA
jgi:AcrR family transcriptional regulator